MNVSIREKCEWKYLDVKPLPPSYFDTEQLKHGP